MKKHKPTKPFKLFFIAFFLFAFCSIANSYGQNHQERFNSIDVLNYQFKIAVYDSSDEIKATATIKIAFKKAVESFILDLKNIKEEGKGMIIDEVLEDGKPANFNHQNDQIELSCKATNEGEQRTYTIKYHGIPDDGLIISTNKFGDRVFFGDNWPNRAHHWLPTVDHPSDKATVEFIVTAPSHYQVVANGLNTEETNAGDEIISHWKTTKPLSTKLMVIGVARFAKQNLISANNIAVSSWVYPQNRAEGFLDYQIATKPLEFYSSHIAPFPFSKLANVQSKTIYGGMENASCIFYAENSVTGEQKNENLFAHEIAHQWFGDAVSEANWHHIWISEGFTTYLTGLYIENTHGKEAFIEWMQSQRKKVLKFANRKLAPVIDTTLAISVDLLSPNSYQKGAWFLHMLRKEIGDELFWKSLKTFYAKFEYKNALTKDYQVIVETLTGKDFESFFDQWLYKSGHPKLSNEWNYDRRAIQLKITQHQKPTIFKFPLDLKIIYEDDSYSIETISVKKAEEQYTIKSKKKPKEIILDPNTWLLFEVVTKVD